MLQEGSISNQKHDKDDQNDLSEQTERPLREGGGGNAEGPCVTGRAPNSSVLCNLMTGKHGLTNSSSRASHTSLFSVAVLTLMRVTGATCSTDPCPGMIVEGVCTAREGCQGNSLCRVYLRVSDNQRQHSIAMSPTTRQYFD